jgi:bifunctional UDP-N-acetylglucosamine pyrophosphorylase/glucosamine-1-phosphate N-acetyltransferase
VARLERREVLSMPHDERIRELASGGVIFLDPSSTRVDPDVEIGAGTTIHPNVTLQGRTRIGRDCEVQSWVRISDSVLGDSVAVNNFCVIVEARVAGRARVGPFAHLRPGADVRASAHVGNFVELKNTILGERSKANHLAYLGDATVGTGVNVGAGTITCNYDGVHKHRTVIEDGAFIGSDTQLIAPVRVGEGAYVAAGSSITSDVPAGALGLSRGRQRNIEGWVARKKRPAPSTD